MGDRANIVLIDSYGQGDSRQEGKVFLYTHWSGSEIEQIAADGLREAIAGGRADDSQYAGRIVTDVFLAAHKGSPHTGAGVSGLIGDGDNHLVEIDFSTGTVTYQTGEDRDVKTTVSFAEFVAAFPATVNA